MPRNHDIITELFYDGRWVDHSSSPVGASSITRGVRSERLQPSPGSYAQQWRNTDGQWHVDDPRNPMWGKVGRLTPVRQSLRPGYTSGPLGVVTDAFDRSVPTTWGNATSGQAWSAGALGTTAAAVGSGVGTMSVTTTSSYRFQYLAGLSCRSATITTRFACPLPTGGDLQPANLMFRGVPGSLTDYEMMRIAIDTSGAFYLSYHADGFQKVAPTLIDGLTHTDGKVWWVTARLAGQHCDVWVWADGDSRSTEPQITFSTGTTPRAGWCGIRNGVTAGNSNSKPVVFTYDNVTITPESPRFCGEVTAWPPRRDIAAATARVPIRAQGLLARLDAGSRELQSPLRRFFGGGVNPPTAYLPCEDGTGATQLASAIPGGEPGTYQGSVSFAAFDGFDGSRPILTLGAGTSVRMIVPDHDPGSEYAVCLYDIPPGGLTDGASLLSMTFPGQDPYVIEVQYIAAGDGDLRIRALERTGPFVIAETTAVNFNVNGTRGYIQLSAVKNGSDIDVELRVRKLIDGTVSPLSWTDTFTSLPLGVPALIVESGARGGGLDGMSIGHIQHATGNILWAEVSEALIGFAGETAADRLTRLCALKGVPLAVEGDAADSTLMGPETAGTWMQAAAEAVAADGGLLSEAPDHIGLIYRTRKSLYNQAAAVSLSFAAQQLRPPFEPTPDGWQARNRVTATRPDGSSYTAEVTTGRLSTADPPDGIGVQEAPIRPNVQADTQLAGQASWATHLGTWDEERYPAVTTALRLRGIVASETLAAQALAVGGGDVVEVTDAPHRADSAQVLVSGIAEGGDEVDWSIAYSGPPAGPFRVYEIEGDGLTGRVAPDSSALDVGYDADDASFSVTSSVRWTDSATYPDMYPVDCVLVETGEVIRVDSVTGTGTTQTFAVTRSRNSVVKPAPAGTHIRFYRGPAIGL